MDCDEQTSYESVVAHDADGFPELQIWESDGREPIAALGLTHERKLRLWYPQAQDLSTVFPTTFRAILGEIEHPEVIALLKYASEPDVAEFIEKLNRITSRGEDVIDAGQ